MSTYVIAEIGVNHQGDPSIATGLIDDAAEAGADAVKFQKRQPELCVPRDQWYTPKLCPWGETLPYIEYRRRMEFDLPTFAELQRHANRAGLDFALSAWDEPSVEFDNRLGCPWLKVPSAKLTDKDLVAKAATRVAERGGRALVLSTGMSTEDEVAAAVAHALRVLVLATPEHLDRPELWVMHCHSAYPAPVHELNLRCIHTLMYEWQDHGGVRVGYSGHELGHEPTEWAVAMGASIVERHITFDRTAIGSDHQASLRGNDLRRLVSHIRSLEDAMGDGRKVVWPSEMPALKKLRGIA